MSSSPVKFYEHETQKLCLVLVGPDSLLRAGALGLWHHLLVRFGNVVETLDDEALGDELSDGKGTDGMLSNRHRRQDGNARGNNYDFSHLTTKS